MSISQAEKGKRFRALHDGPGTFVIPNPSNAGTARILTSLGFKALATTSAGVAFSLGRRDGAGLVSREETLEHAREIVEASDLPVSADLEKCFGDEPEIVAETIRKAAAVGLVGGSVEDATGDPNRPIYHHVLAVKRVAAAVAHRDGRVEEAMHDQYGKLERHVGERVSDRVAFGQLFGRTTHQGLHRAAGPVVVAADEITHAGLRDRLLETYTRASVDGARRARR